MMQTMLHIVEMMHSGHRSPDDLPAIRISQICASKDGIGSPAAIANLIVIPETFVDHCLGADFATIESVIASDSDLRWWRYPWIAYLGFSWAVAHEYMHLLRSHWIFDAPDGTRTDEVSLATERDADLCAMAIIYRYLQRYCVRVSDDATLRQIALYSVFWIARSLPRHSAAATHLPMSVRLQDMASKLAMLREDPNDPPDPGAELPETLERMAYLQSCFVKCEKAYLSLHPNEESMKAEVMAAIENGTLDRVGKTWDELSQLVRDPRER